MMVSGKYLPPGRGRTIFQAIATADDDAKIGLLAELFALLG